MGSREGLNLQPPLPRDPGLGREDPELCAQQDSYTNTYRRFSTTSPSIVHELN